MTRYVVLSVAVSLSAACSAMFAVTEQVSASDVDLHIRTIQDEQAPVKYRRRACRRLAAEGANDSRTIPTLMAALEDHKIGYWAAVALRRLGANGRRAVLRTGRRRHTSNSHLRLMRRLVLSSRTPFDELTHTLDARSPAVRFWAVRTLDVLGRAERDFHRRSAERLQQVLRNDSDPMVRLTAAEALARAYPQDASSVKYVVEILKNDDNVPLLRAQAARVLGMLHTKSRYVVPPLVAALDTSDPGLMYAAAKSLRHVSTGNYKPTIPALLRASKVAGALGDKHLLQTITGTVRQILERIRNRRWRDYHRRQARKDFAWARRQRQRVREEIAAVKTWLLAEKMRSRQRSFDIWHGAPACRQEARYYARLAESYLKAREYYARQGNIDLAKRYNEYAGAARDWSEFYNDQAAQYENRPDTMPAWAK